MLLSSCLIGLFLLWVVSLLFLNSPRVRCTIHPSYQRQLQAYGLITTPDFFDLPMEVVSGHPDRRVSRIVLGNGSDRLSAFLKLEYRTPWHDRLANALAGFGGVSKSYREGRVLLSARQAGLGCPEVLAVGEDGKGQAFLLVRELAGAVDLRVFLQDRLHLSPIERRRFARHLGESLARLHIAGFDHPDLYSKHVLVNPLNENISFLDWQRSRQLSFISWQRRCRDLAALDATLAGNLAEFRERLACLFAYLESIQGKKERDEGKKVFPFGNPTPPKRQVFLAIQKLSLRLQRRRRILELRHKPLEGGLQNLVCLDGEALCVTREFQASFPGKLPSWLSSIHLHCQGVDKKIVQGLAGGQAVMVRRQARSLAHCLWSLLRRRPWTSPELEQAAILFRLQRYGIACPRLLALGQRFYRPGRRESFLVTEFISNSVPFPEWLARRTSVASAGDKVAADRKVIRDAGILLRQLHEAGCYLSPSFRNQSALLTWECPFFVQTQSGERFNVFLGLTAGVRKKRRRSRTLALADLKVFRDLLFFDARNRTNGLRFLCAYLGANYRSREGRRLVRQLIRFSRKTTKNNMHSGFNITRPLLLPFLMGPVGSAFGGTINSNPAG